MRVIVTNLLSSGAPSAPKPRQAVARPKPASPRPHDSVLRGSSTTPVTVATRFSSPATPSARSAGRQRSTARSIPATASGAFSTGLGIEIPAHSASPATASANATGTVQGRMDSARRSPPRAGPTTHEETSMVTRRSVACARRAPASPGSEAAIAG